MPELGGVRRSQRSVVFKEITEVEGIRAANRIVNKAKNYDLV